MSFGDTALIVDRVNYYNSYTALANGDLEQLFVWGKGVEIMTPLFWLVTLPITGYLDHTYFSMMHAVVMGILFYI
ncbi:hypothetical protein [uncultured Helicobacter sp.]|uniref:hypothetical protein n=1 Tax=uncultured Helicobacter sp. TaxID=175537 RepID=UPI00374F459F